MYIEVVVFIIAIAKFALHAMKIAFNDAEYPDEPITDCLSLHTLYLINLIFN